MVPSLVQIPGPLVGILWQTRIVTRPLPLSLASWSSADSWLFRYQGHIGTYLIMGGVDVTGPHLYEIAAHGSTSKVPYCTMGSGTLAAMSVLESRWVPDMSEEDAKQLVRDAIRAGIFNDMGSGSYVDLVVIKPKDDVQYLRTFDEANVKGERREKYTYPKGATAVLTEKVRDIKVGDKNHAYIVDSEVVRPIPMET